MGTGWPTSGQDVSEDLRVCPLDAIDDGAAKGFLPDARGRDRIVVVRQGETVHAYLNLCPHYDKVRLGWKNDGFLNGDNSRIMCAAHGALFRIDDGACVIGPCQGEALRRVRTVVQGGHVRVRVADLPFIDGADIAR